MMMGELGGDEVLLLAAGYTAVSVLLVVNLASCILPKSSCSGEHSHDDGHDRDNADDDDDDDDDGGGGDAKDVLIPTSSRSWGWSDETGSHDSDDDADAGRRHQYAAGVCYCSSKTLLSTGLCLALLGVSVATLVMSCKAPSTIDCLSKSLLAAMLARIAFAIFVLSWLIVRASARRFQGDRALKWTVGRAAMVILGAALLWRAARLAYIAVREIPDVQAFVYLEGLCAIGSILALSAVWPLQGEREVLLSSLGNDGDLERASSRREAEQDVLGSAGWISLLTFAWLNPLFNTGASRQLQPTDLPPLTREDRSASWAERFRLALENERKFPRPSLVRACRTTFGREFLSLGWLKAASTGIGFSGPLLLKVVVDAVQDGSSATKANSMTKGYLGAAGLVVCYALSAVLDTQFCLRLGRLQLHVRASIVTAVYRQILNVRNVDAAGVDVNLTTGGATNLIAVDAQRLMDCAGSLHELWGLPVQVGVTFYLLHREVSFAFAAGLIVIAAMIPLNAALAKRIGVAARELMRHKDDRVERCSELLRDIRAVKMLAWENYLRDRIEVSRNAEVSALSGLKYVDAWCVFFWATTPTLVCFATFATLVVIRGEDSAPLRVSSVFAAISLLQMLIHPMNAFPWVMNGIVEARVSKARLEKLLLLLVPPKSGTSTKSGIPSGISAGTTGGKDEDSGSDEDSMISWQGVTIFRRQPAKDAGLAVTLTEDNDSDIPDLEDGGILEPLLPRGGDFGDEMKGEGAEEDTRGDGRRGLSEFAVRNLCLEVKRGESVAIVGGVGSGKSTVIAGILGELAVRSPSSLPKRSSGVRRFEDGIHMDMEAIVGLELGREGMLGMPGGRSGKARALVCYAAQSPWVMSGTVRENVLFGLPMNEDCYRKTLAACALEADLVSIPGGDLAFVGERGATLSGGQRLRVSLARCVYSLSFASIASPTRSVLCLLDEPLASLDATTRDHVSQQCVHGLLRRNPRAAVVVTCGEISPRRSNVDDNGGTVTTAKSNAGASTPSEEHESPPLLSSVIIQPQDTANTAPIRLQVPSSLDTNMTSSLLSSSSSSVTTEVLFDKVITLASGHATTVTNIPTAAASAASINTECKTMEHDCGVMPDTIDGGGGLVDSYREEGGDKAGGAEECSSAVNTAQWKAGAGAMEEEARKDGAVQLRIFLLYARSAGLLVTLGTLVSLGLMQASAAGFSYWLAHWVTHQGRASVRSFLLTSLSIATANAAFTLMRAFGFAYGGIRAAKVLHHRLLIHVLRKKTWFFDITPSGRVVNRFSRDVFSVDENLPFHLNVLLAQAAGLMATMVVLSSTSPILLLIFLPLGVVYGRLQRYYRRSSRELRRLDSTSRSPMYALFAETLDGAVTIRAFEQEDMFFERFVELLAANQRATFTGSMASAWLSLRLQVLGVVVVGAVAFLALAQQHIWRLQSGIESDDLHVYRDDGDEGQLPGQGGEGEAANSNSGGLVGLSLTYALPIVANLTGLLGALTETEREMISVERIDGYCGNDASTNTNTNTDHAWAGNLRHDEEDTSTDIGGRGAHDDCDEVSEGWPSQGMLEVSKVVMRYRDDLTPSLDGVSFVISPGEKVGIVGRTGSGKTSLLRVLFGLYAYEGTMKIDGVDTSKLPLHVLRSRLAVIPQEPLLFRGTVRENLDPSGEHPDAALWGVLRSCGLVGPVKGDGSEGTGITSTSSGTIEQALHFMDDGGGAGNTDVFGLETAVEGSGGCLSAGQRQLMCIARALLRRSKVVCIDEATSTMDASTAELIDATFFKAFRNSTIVAVAHRLSSVMKNCDSVVVMSEGKVAERGSPRELSGDRDTAFSALLRARDGKGETG